MRTHEDSQCSLAHRLALRIQQLQWVCALKTSCRPNFPPSSWSKVQFAERWKRSKRWSKAQSNCWSPPAKLNISQPDFWHKKAHEFMLHTDFWHWCVWIRVAKMVRLVAPAVEIGREGYLLLGIFCPRDQTHSTTKGICGFLRAKSNWIKLRRKKHG